LELNERTICITYGLENALETMRHKEQVGGTDGRTELFSCTVTE